MWNRILEGHSGSFRKKLIDAGILLGFLVTASVLLR